MRYVPHGTMLALILLLAAAPAAAAQLPGIPQPIVNETPDTLDVFAVLPPGFGWVLALALPPGDSVTAVVPALAVTLDRHFWLGVRPVGTPNVHIAGRWIPGARTIHITKNRAVRMGVVGT